MSDPLILIPARMASTRLPGKMLADIHGLPMIVRVWQRAVESGIGPVVVATDSREILAVVEAAGGAAVMTSEAHQSGSDRIFEALQAVDPESRHDVIVNLQGDLPTLDPRILGAALLPLANPAVDIATLGALITRDEEKTDPNVVKIIGSEITPHHLRALYFTRATAPWGQGPLVHHIGLYAYRRKALEYFVGLTPSKLEMREKLEQLRALEAGLRIDAVIVDTVPLGVDGPHDLERARDLLARDLLARDL
jgi:3-deoxy-D-manno-octulosonate cytidylyltransferase